MQGRGSVFHIFARPGNIERTFWEVLVNMDTLQVMMMMLVVMVGLRQSGQVDTPQVSNI